MGDRNKPDHNRTGTEDVPEMLAEMLAAVAEFPPTSGGTDHADEAVRVAYAREVDPGPLEYGTVPTGEPRLLVDKLGERLAFERTGVRLYEMLIAKLDAFGGFAGGPSRAALEQILNEEHCHFSLLIAAVEGVGGDPTAVTPSADLVGVVATGITQVLADPRTTLVQGLEAILVAELADNAGWNMLRRLAAEAGLDELAESFAEAEQTEERHREQVEAWLAAALEID